MAENRCLFGPRRSEPIARGEQYLFQMCYAYYQTHSLTPNFAHKIKRFNSLLVATIAISLAIDSIHQLVSFFPPFASGFAPFAFHNGFKKLRQRNSPAK